MLKYPSLRVYTIIRIHSNSALNLWRWSVTFKHRADLGGPDVVSEALRLDIAFHSSAQCLAFHRSWTHLTAANESKGLDLGIPHITVVLCYSSSDGEHKAFGFKQDFVLFTAGICQRVRWHMKDFKSRINGTNNHKPAWTNMGIQQGSSLTVFRFANISSPGSACARDRL